MRNKKSQKEENLAKLPMFRSFFADVVDKNFYARCKYVQLIFYPATGKYERFVDGFNPPPLPPNAIPFPLVSLKLDLKCLCEFFGNHRDLKHRALDPDVLIGDDPFANAYDELLCASLFDAYHGYRARFYDEVFDDWAKAYRNEIGNWRLNGR